MFSLPFLFPSSKDVIKEEIHQEAASPYVQQGESNLDQFECDESCSCSSSSNESDSRFMSEQETSFVALHSHQRVQHLNQVAEHSSKLVPLHVPSNGYDDISQVSFETFEYESSAASLDTSVDLNPYATGNNVSSLSHMEIAMRWRKNFAKQKSIESISDTPGHGKVVVASNIHIPERESSSSSYISLSNLHESSGYGMEKSETLLYSPNKSSSSTEGYVGESGNSPVLERTLRKASLSVTRSDKSKTFILGGKAKGSLNDVNARGKLSEELSPPCPPQIVKKRYSGSQFQISPLARRSRKALSSDYPLSEAKRRFTTKTKINKKKKEDKIPKVKLGLGSGRDMNENNVDPNGGCSIIVIPVGELENNTHLTETYNLQASVIEWPTEGEEVLYPTPKSRSTNDSNPQKNQTPTTCQTPSELSNVSQSRFGRESFITDYSSDSSDSSISRIPKFSPCRQTPCSMLNDPSGSPAKSQFLMRLNSMKTQQHEIKELGTKCQSPQQCADNVYNDVVNILDPSIDPKAATLHQGAHGLQRRTKQWLTQIWSPESEEWDYVRDEGFATASMHTSIHFEDLNATMSMTDGDEDSLEFIFKQADEEEEYRGKSSIFQWTQSTTENESSLIVGQMPINESNSSESSLAYSMSTTSMMVSSSNNIDLPLSKPITLRRARGSFTSPSMLGITQEMKESATRASFKSKQHSIMKAAEFNYNLLTEFEVQDRHIAATMIQTTYLGYLDRYRLMEMLGVAKRKRYMDRTKSPAVTKIHSNIRRAARKVLRSKHDEAEDGDVFVASMAVAVRQICAIQIQKWWRKQLPLLKARRVEGFHSSAIPLCWNTKSSRHKLPEFIIDKNHDYRLPQTRRQRLISTSSADSKRTTTTKSSTSERFDKGYYNKSHANLYGDDADGHLKVEDENFEVSVSLLRKLHNGVIGRFVKIFSKRFDKVKNRKKGKKSMKRLKDLFKRGKKSADPIAPMLGDPDVNADLPDPLSLYRRLDEAEECNDQFGAEEDTALPFEEDAVSKEFTVQWNVTGDVDAFSLMAESLANDTHDGEFSLASFLENNCEEHEDEIHNDDDVDADYENDNKWYAEENSEYSVEDGSAITLSTCPTPNSVANESVPWDEI